MFTKIKLQTGFLILVSVSALILFIKSYGDEERLSSLNTSFDEMYKDRLIVERYIYSMTDLVYKKKLLLAEWTTSEEFKNEPQKNINGELLKIAKDFSQTKLTSGEALLLAKLQACVNRIQAEDLAMQFSTQKKSAYEILYNEMLSTLEKLSEIQMIEGQKLKTKSQASVASSLAGLKLQSAIYVVLLISLLALTQTMIIRKGDAKKYELN